MPFINSDFYIFAFEENRNVNESLTVLKRKLNSDSLGQQDYVLLNSKQMY